MRLSMWMIASMLRSLDIEEQIREDAAPTLRSARFAYAPNCICITQHGADSWCTADSDRIVIKDADTRYAFEIIQDIFDFYDSWNTSTTALAKDRNWQAIVNSLSIIVGNPVVLFDANNRVLAMSESYGPGDVSNEWDYLMKYGASSPSAARSGREPGGAIAAQGPQSYITEATAEFDKSATLTTKVLCGEAVWGYFSVQAKSSAITRGTVQTLEFLASIIAESLAAHPDRQPNYSLFVQCLTSTVDNAILSQQIAALGWSPSDELSVFAVRSRDGIAGKDNLRALQESVLGLGPALPAVLIDNTLAIVANAAHNACDRVTRLLEERAEDCRVDVGVGMPCRSVYDLRYYFKQAVFALKPAYQLHGQDNPIHSFYDSALNFFIVSDDRAEQYHACHPAVLRMYANGDPKNAKLFHSLLSYLEHNRSITRAADAMFMHRNTMLYQIQRIKSAYGIELEDPYEFEYVFFSLRLLNIIIQEKRLEP